MKTLEPRLALLAALLAGTLVGCSMTGTKSGGISASIRKSLDHAGFKDVSAGQDRGKSVVTLSGFVGSEAEKLQAEAIAKSIAPGEVVSNQMVVAVPGDDDSVNDVKVVNPDLNKGIGKNLVGVLAIISQTEPRSHCKKYTDVYLHNSSSRIISVDVTRTNNVDKQTSVLTYTIDPDQTGRPGTPRVGGRRTSALQIGCQFDGPKTYTYSITRAEDLK
jgi:hypothetical protein